MPTIKRGCKKYKWQEDKPSGFDTMSKQDGLYNSRKWRNKSRNYLKANPLCVMCKANNIIAQATVTDHIKPIDQGGEIWDERNMQGLCASCHGKKSSMDRKNLKNKNHEQSRL